MEMIGRYPLPQMMILRTETVWGQLTSPSIQVIQHFFTCSCSRTTFIQLKLKADVSKKTRIQCIRICFPGRRVESDNFSTDYSVPRTSSISLSLVSNDRSEPDYSVEVLGTEDTTEYNVEVLEEKSASVEVLGGEDATVEVLGGEHGTVEVLGGEDPPEEWQSLAKDGQSAVSKEEDDLSRKDEWKLRERDNDCLEVNVCY